MAITAKVIRPEIDAQPAMFAVTVAGSGDTSRYSTDVAAADVAIHLASKGHEVTIRHQPAVTRDLGHVQINMTAEDANGLLKQLRSAMQGQNFQGTELARLCWELASNLPIQKHNS